MSHPITKASKEDAEEFIKYATEQLKGPLTITERMLLVADRKDAREYLRQLEKTK